LADTGSGAYYAQLEGIKAPLGVILFLIKRNNLDVYDIPIARITLEYLQYLDMMEKLNIELAGEFFVMAATLMRIKAQMLLRKEDDQEDPREELVRSLIEYQKMAEAARTLKSLEEERYRIFTRSVPTQDKEFEPQVELELNLYELMKAFREIAANFAETEVREIEPEAVTIEDKIKFIVQVLSREKQVSFSDLFAKDSSRLELIVTFIAVLELIKEAFIKARQEGPFGTIWLYRNENSSRPISRDDETTNAEDLKKGTSTVQEGPIE
jgi:segregation and condensation protein A